MSTPHTPEPWHLSGDGVYIAAGISPGQPYLACFTFGSHWRPAGTSEANCKRAVACVNACAGMADPAADINALRETLRFVMLTGDERTGKEIYCCCPLRRDEGTHSTACQQARALLATLEPKP